jgi:hypothetical protein
MAPTSAAENGFAMDFLELIFGLIEALDLIPELCKAIVWLFRSLYRLCRWMMGYPEPSEGWVYIDQTRGSHDRAAGGHILHLSLTRRRRGKWQGASYVLR